MANNMRYFIGNWKMFGVPKSINIVNKINTFVKSNKKYNKKYKIIITPPFTLIESFSKRFKKKNILLEVKIVITKIIFGSNTGAVSPFMIKKIRQNMLLLAILIIEQKETRP